MTGIQQVGGAARSDRPRPVMMIAPHPCFEARGTPMNVQLMCLALSELGFEVHLVTCPMGKTIEIPGLTYHRVAWIPFLRRVPIGFSVAKMAYDVLLFARAARLLMQRRYAAVHAVEEALFFATPLARLFRTPLIADLDSDMSDQLSGHRSAAVRALAHPVRPMQRWTIRRAACALTVCRALTEHVERVCPGKKVFQIEDVPLPGADRAPVDARTAALRDEHQLDGRQVILYTGNLQPYQGVDLLLEAMSLVVRKRPSALALIVGGEPDEVARYRAQCDKKGLGGHVRWMGQRDPETMPDILALADVLVSPRREGENTPLKIYTYMASGRPIVATDLPTHTQVLDTSNAVLVEATAEGMAAGLIRVLERPADCAPLAVRAREKVLRDHSYDGFRDKLGDVYRFVTGDSTATAETTI